MIHPKMTEKGMTKSLYVTSKMSRKSKVNFQ